ncbi:interferon lambda receptor 1 [Brienomyrus brachyistius]|uniref:interferon lambda receptor 1 n=1 Tax=Brienomyrus brachyistius TaxID=42636 RepID=UPI0020B32EA0|nr:interferon lambda receptor 1 [Brienomyrus brachyistius]
MWSSGDTILVLCCVGCSIAQVLQFGNPYFESRNFRNVLRWNLANSTDHPVLYSVQYNIYGTEWKEKRECQNITALSCDLTAETSDITELYHGRVTVNGGKPVLSPRFCPIRDTVLGSPEVSVSPEMESVTLTLKVPVGPENRASPKELQRDRVKVIISCTVMLTPAEQMPCHEILDPQKHLHTNTSDGSEVTIHGLKANTEYCGLATYTMEYDKKKRSSHSAVFNVKTHTGPMPLKPLVVTSAVVGFLLIMALLTTTVWLYISRKRRIPYSLTLTRSKLQQSCQHYSKENVYISRLEFRTITPHISIEPHGLQEKGLVSREEPHPLQDCNNAVLPCHSYANQQGLLQSNTDSAQSFTHYSLVAGVQYDNDKIEWFQQPAPETEAGGGHLQITATSTSSAHFNSVGRPLMLESEPGPLVLLTKKGPNGLLQLPELFALLTPEIPLGDLGSASGPCREGAPMLSCLITQEDEERQDSMPTEDHVVRTYLPSQTNPMFCRSPLSPPSPHQTLDTMSNSPALILPPTTANWPSSYMQNWIPGAPPPATASGETPHWGAVDSQPQPEEGEVGTFLEKWEVKIEG